VITLQLDMKAFEQAAKRLNAAADQVPYALSRAMNDAVRETRERLANETWPTHVTVRSSTFMRRALQTVFSNKYNLTVIVYDALQHANLFQHAFGGVKRVSTRNIAIPLKNWVKYTAHGVSAVQLPRAIIANTPKRALRITPTGIFVGEAGRLRLRYKLQPTAQINADVPFQEDFIRFMREATEKAFPQRIAEAMATRK
jgi:hypothetical protein